MNRKGASSEASGRRNGCNGQVHTLEAFGAFFIIVLASILTVQAISVQPEGTASHGTVLQNEKAASDVLEASQANGSLEAAILNWSGGDGFNGSLGSKAYYSGDNSVPGELGDVLSALGPEDAYSIHLFCGGERHPFVRNGEGGSASVTESSIITLSDGDRLGNGIRLEDSVTYPCTDSDVNSTFYSSVEVQMTVWER